MVAKDSTGENLVRQITVWSVICIAVTFVTVVSIAAWMARSHDIEAARATHATVRGVVENARIRLAATITDSSQDEAYRAYTQADRTWLDTHVGASVITGESADAAVIISPAGRVEYGWTRRGAGSAADIITPQLLSEVAAGLESGAGNALTLFSRSGADVLIVAASPMAAPSDDARLRTQELPLIITAQRLDNQWLGDLGKAFALHDFKVVATEPSADSLPLNNAAGAPVAYLSWTAPTPGAQILFMGFQPLLFGLALFCLTMLAISYRTRMLALALRRSEQKAQAIARVDPQTGLINRLGFNELVESQEFSAAAESGKLAVIYLDVNGFKQVNDTVGHEGGDELVRAIAARFKEALPQDSYLARVGGDEFALLLCGPSSARVNDAATALINTFEQPFTVANIEFYLSCAVGYDISGPEASKPDAVIRRADTAMYRAKAGKLREPLRFRASMDTGALEKKHFEQLLRTCLREGGLDVVYQPIGRASDCAVVGLEALVRWDSPVLGDVSPSKLVAAAEESGLIRELGDFVLERVCEDLHRWPNLRISVNVSPVQLRDPDFISNFKATLARHNARPERIEIELTENVLIADPVSAAKKLAQLRRLGVTIALDDFGTGFSSIGYMRTFPFDRVKIDRSFTLELENGDGDTRLIHSLVSVATAMKLPTVAEGVETAEQVRLLNLSGCEFIQGYFLHRPAPAPVIQEYVRTHGVPAEKAAAEGSVIKLKRR
jgi:diguanylate cyclase (GGDEF)-like protein